MSKRFPFDGVRHSSATLFQQFFQLLCLLVFRFLCWSCFRSSSAPHVIFPSYQTASKLASLACLCLLQVRPLLSLLSLRKGLATDFLCGYSSPPRLVCGFPLRTCRFHGRILPLAMLLLPPFSTNGGGCCRVLSELLRKVLDGLLFPPLFGIPFP